MGVFFKIILAAGLGFEPRYSGPKPDVLPLDDPAIFLYNTLFYVKIQYFSL